MKTLFVIKYLNGASGGAERVLSLLVNELFLRNLNVEILTFDYNLGKGFYEINPAIPIHRRGSLDPKDKTSLAYLLKKIFILRKVIKKNKYTSVVGFMHSSFIPLAISTIGLKTKVYASEHITIDFYRDRPFDLILYYLVQKMIYRWVFISEDAAKGFPSFFNAQKSFIGNLVNVKQTKGNDAPRRKNIILCIARNSPQKNLSQLIDAISFIRDELSSWTLCIYGADLLGSTLERDIKLRGLTDKIHLSNPVADVEKLYQEASFLVLPSLYESFGMVISEAIISGLPVIGFQSVVFKNPFFVDRLNGIAIKTDCDDRVVALSKIIKELINDSDYLQSLSRPLGSKDIARYNSSVVDEWICLLNSQDS